MTAPQAMGYMHHDQLAAMFAAGCQANAAATLQATQLGLQQLLAAQLAQQQLQQQLSQLPQFAAAGGAAAAATPTPFPQLAAAPAAATAAPASNTSALDGAQISKLLHEREKARRNQDFQKADVIRAQLRSMDIVWDDDMKTWKAADGRSGKWGTPSPAAAAMGAAQAGYCVKMKGLPYRVKYDDIKTFFGTIGVAIVQYSLVLEKNGDGRPSGVGHVKVSSERDQQLAVKKLNHKNIGDFGRYVWVCGSTQEEYDDAASRWTAAPMSAATSLCTTPAESPRNSMNTTVGTSLLTSTISSSCLGASRPSSLMVPPGHYTLSPASMPLSSPVASEQLSMLTPTASGKPEDSKPAAHEEAHEQDEEAEALRLWELESLLTQVAKIPSGRA